MPEGSSAKRIRHDLVAAHGFTGSYQSVKRCIRSLGQRLALPYRPMERPRESRCKWACQDAPEVDERDKVRRPHLFRAVLSQSRKGYIPASAGDQDLGMLACNVEQAQRRTGGLPPPALPSERNR